MTLLMVAAAFSAALALTSVVLACAGTGEALVSRFGSSLELSASSGANFRIKATLAA